MKYENSLIIGENQSKPTFTYSIATLGPKGTDSQRAANHLGKSIESRL